MAELRQIFGFWYALFLIGVVSLLVLARANEGALLILSFDGDAVHMAQIVLRMVDGQVPHQDFLTPLGAMAFLPIVWLVQLGVSIGTAFAYAPVFISILMLPAVYWVGISRLAPSGAIGFGAVVLVQMLALVHGGTDATVAVSMYYNNWCWAMAAIVVVMVALPNSRVGRVANVIEPIILGVLMGVMVLVKATYAVFLLPAILAAMLMSGQGRNLGLGIIVALVFLGIVTLPYGVISYCQGYVADLMFVAQSAARAQPGDALGIMVIRPAQIVGVIALVVAFVLLRQARLAVQSLVFLLLALGWILISHQNWQNDPHWLIVAGLVVIGMSRDAILYNRYGWPVQTALRVVAVVFFAAGAPLLVTQAQSILVHSGLNGSGFAPALADPRHDDLRFRRVTGGPYTVATPHPTLIMDAKEPFVFQGKALADCQKTDGLVAELVQTGALLDGLEQTRGAQILYADWVNALWLFSKTKPLQEGAPWYYGGTAGFKNAAFLVVPKCPMGQAVRGMILNAIAEDGSLKATLDAETPLFYLYKMGE